MRRAEEYHAFNSARLLGKLLTCIAK
jgi:hypothetical protein